MVAVVRSNARVVGLLLCCEVCGDDTTLRMAEDCDGLEEILTEPASRWMMGHRGPGLAGVEVFAAGRRQWHDRTVNPAS